MVFHILPALAVAGVKAVIKGATDAPACGKCGKEKMKMWAGIRLIFLCEDCEDGMTVKLGLKAVQIATFGVCFCLVSSRAVYHLFYELLMSVLTVGKLRLPPTLKDVNCIWSACPNPILSWL